jgi:septum site-determining protein MinC
MLRDEFEIVVISSPKKEAKLVLANEPLGVKEEQEIASDTAAYLNGLFEGENSLYNSQAVEWSSASEIIAKLEDNKESNKKMPASGDYLDRVSNVLGDDCFYDDEANAKVIFGTLRSGQRIETPFSLIVVGDVNPGADLIAGGDIIILGNLRGTAHAAAYDDAEDRVIFALKMQPMQLRIGTIISRGSNECGKTPEIARVENKRIIVESFSSRGSTLKKR